ncbi:hypothetical protein DPMN_025343 [Dreissena polymorpha]|uniref:Uncharacterized protein n=1 Tax=Dreissena polymorpha TaxID=45954 RepID=A0A9D4LRC6_DREPO|nr:hypothetical protein DPMN_025343 [Dreissena polymorpha]
MPRADIMLSKEKRHRLKTTVTAKFPPVILTDQTLTSTKSYKTPLETPAGHKYGTIHTRRILHQSKITVTSKFLTYIQTLIQAVENVNVNKVIKEPLASAGGAKKNT